MGKRYKLTKDAESDLREVARYTLGEWGSSHFKVYRAGLNKAFVDLAENKLAGKSFSNGFPRLRVKKYRYHYIFYLFNTDQKAVIVGVIHEKRDIVSRLRERIE
jgi:toxin ParE1/3/4|tara:strand:+ start:376 stop:687 length:312 start_codon:yes stop_codon:yes gene_type:complete